MNFLTSILVAFVFILSSYTLSRKPGLEYLYSIGTFLGVLMLAPVIVETENGLV
ncbi:MAG: hypothetical protein H6767_09140 [Candidatus Peribacteria bacterium]|nr:MAG: hypothetical protein H6767_09140 [Candidatus Peribacteria bacterium]